MDREIKTWLYDVLQSIIEIESYFENSPKVVLLKTSIFDDFLTIQRTLRDHR
jgi:uncharacterized protein with HEPN domain